MRSKAVDRATIVPAFLRPGGRVVVAAPSGVVDKRRLRAGLSYLERMGHPARLAPGVLSRHGYLAGTDERRASAFNAIIASDATQAVFFARGGYGIGRILDRLDLAALRRKPRSLLGYSDLTALFMALQCGSSYLVHYGPVVSELGNRESFDEASLWGALYGDPAAFDLPFRNKDILRPGRAAGRLIGGCLTLLVSLLGTRHDPDYAGALLFWEEIGEPPYRIDRMLTQLRSAGKLRRLRGMVVGSLTGCRAQGREATLPLRRVILDACRDTTFPIIWNVPVGHVKHKRTLPLGLPAVLDTSARSLRVRRPRGR
ncbi:MAG: LD-carboxypeptidase [Acidobacteriota bacterium]